MLITVNLAKPAGCASPRVDPGELLRAEGRTAAAPLTPALPADTMAGHRRGRAPGGEPELAASHGEVDLKETAMKGWTTAWLACALGAVLLLSAPAAAEEGTAKVRRLPLREYRDKKYQKSPEYRKASCERGDYNIDAKLNGAYVAMGLLHGAGDPEWTIVIATRCGQDSDCNPSSAAGVLFASLGFSRVPGRFKEKLDATRLWSHAEYSFPRLLEVCEKVARDAVRRAGGRIEKDAAGEEVFVIPVRAARPSALERCWSPGSPAGSRFSEGERAKIRLPAAESK
ncbi:MAG: ADP-ribosylglycohydrolase family protein [Planctomycetes bacterium]|nr:ADP-ribosylglycohydrolase family protein [Planctomycetota bacterium]